MKKILISSAVLIALLTGCTEEKVTEEKKVEEPKKEVVVNKTPEEKLVDQVKESTTQVASTIAQESKKVADLSGDAVKSVTEKVVKTTKEVTTKVVDTASETKNKIEESIDTIVKTKNSSKDLVDQGKALYMKCAGCHGQNAENAALGKSKVIKGWTKDEIVSALVGYKEGNYGGVMKGVMKSQVSSMSKEDIDAVASYISTFK